MATLELQNVSKHFGGVKAITGASFTVRGGEITGLIGPNGAGKSTIVNLITGMLSLTQGAILLNGEQIHLDSPEVVVRRGVARTFQNIRLLSEASVLANVVIGFHRHETASILSGLLGLPSSRKSSAELDRRGMILLEKFGLARFAEHPAGALSYGHQRRLEMARAVASDPTILLLDEPVAGMNDAEASQLGDTFRDLAAAGVGMMLIEHNVRFVASLCRTVHVLDAGRIIASGSAAEVLRDPAVIQAYLGSVEA